MSEMAFCLAQRAATDPHPASLRDRHLLQGALRRWSASSQAGAFLLRGGLMTQLWAGPARRATRDLDFLGLFPLDLIDTLARLEEILATPVEPDGIVFSPQSLVGEVIWQETAFPGLRFHAPALVFGEESPLQIDVGFGDPVVPPSQWIDYPCLFGPHARVHAVGSELLVAWKLDGLFDHGARRWQAKDLNDLHLLTTYCRLDQPALTEAVRVAFEAHGDPLEEILTVLYDPQWWSSPGSRAKWERFRAAAATPVPEDLPGVAGAVAKALRPALEPLLRFPS